MTDLVIVLALGSIVGIAAGLFGVGGGLLIVPALTELYGWRYPGADWTVHLAVGSSLASIAFTGLSASLAHHRRGAVRWDWVRRTAVYLALGAVSGSILAWALDARALRGIFGIFELTVAVQVGLARLPEGPHRHPGPTATALGGGVIGAISALVGIGGGTLSVPWLLWYEVPMHQAVATASALGLPSALTGGLGFVVAGSQAAGLPAGSTGFVHWPAVLLIAAASVLTAPLGARLAHALPARRLKRGFAIVLAVIGLRMVWGAMG